MIRPLAALIVCLLLVAVPARADEKKQTEATAGSPKADAKRGSKKVKQSAVITMEKGGEIVIDFYPEDAPKTVENFVTLARKGFYDGVTFHRVEPGFVAQGGDPKGTGMGGPGYTIKAEFNERKHVRGTVAMARTQDPDSAGSQFYICFKPAPFLDGQYTVFGIVTKGMDVVDGIKVGDKMKSVKIVEKPAAQ
jgi:peptidylprolyl isomerase/peptidyl-prolyl cis-trans isomerase B (cyclophilin B)